MRECRFTKCHCTKLTLLAMNITLRCHRIGRKMRSMRTAFSAVFVAYFLACNSSLGDWIDFSGISPASLPMTINYDSNTVTISQVSAPAVGTPQLEQYLPSPGTN